MLRQQLSANSLRLQPAQIGEIQPQLRLQVHACNSTEFRVIAQLYQIWLAIKALSYKPKVGRNLSAFWQHQYTALLPQPLLPKRLILLAGKYYGGQINSRQGLVSR